MTDEKTHKRPCARCEGKGHWFTPHGLRNACAACRGTGKVDPRYACPDCEGRGGLRVIDGEYNHCPACGGIGRVVAPKESGGMGEPYRGITDTSHLRPRTFSVLAFDLAKEQPPEVVAQGALFWSVETRRALALPPKAILWHDSRSLRLMKGARSFGTSKEIDETLAAIGRNNGLEIHCVEHNDVWQRGADHAYLDRCEGCIWASLRPGGRGNQGDPCPNEPVAPDYVEAGHRLHYIAGYLEAMKAMIG